MQDAFHELTRRQMLVNSGKLIVGTSLIGSFVAACGGPSSGSSPSSVTLNYWSLGYAPKGANLSGKLVDGSISAYQKQHAGVKVNVTSYTGDQAGATKLTQAVQGGNTVDIFSVSSDLLPLLVKQNLVAPIDDYLTASDKSDFYPAMLNAVATNGKHYAWPKWVPPVGMYLNLDIFKERGIDVPGDDWTYEDFVNIAQRLTFTRSNGQKVYGYTGVIDPGVVNTWPIIMSDGAFPLNQDNTKYTFNSPEGISGLQKLVDLVHKYKVTPPDFGTQTVSDLTTGFSQQKIYAMYSEPSGSAATYQSLNMNFTVKPMPIGATGKHVTAGGIGLVAVASMSDQNKLKVAMDLGHYFTSAEVAHDVSGYYLAPGSRKSVTVGPPISIFTPFVPYTYIIPIIAQWPQIRTIIHPQLQKAVLGQLSAADALNGSANEINSLLANNS